MGEGQDSNTLLVGAPKLDDNSATDYGHSRQVRIWKRGEKLNDSKVILETTKKETGFFLWSMYNGDDYVPIVSLWLKSGGGHTYVYRENKIERLSHPLEINSFHAFYKKRLFLQLEKSWLKFKKGDIIAYPIDNSAPELVMKKPDNFGFTDLVTTKNAVIVSYNQGGQGFLAEIKRKKSGVWKYKRLKSSGNENLNVMSVDYFSSKYLFLKESFLEPKTLFGREKLRRRRKIVQSDHHFNVAGLETKKYTAISKDGTKVPYTIVKKKGTQRVKTILYGYGAFGYSVLPTYKSDLGKIWLEDSGAYVIAHIRGGSDYGIDWHLDGRGIHKQNSIDDFIAVAEDLIKRNFSESKRIGIWGASAGGLLVSATMLQRPDLFGAVVSEYGVQDIFKIDGDEYGDSNNPDHLSAITKLSPYQNIYPNKQYPPSFIITSHQDFTVHPFHSRKFHAKLNEVSNKSILLEKTAGSHTSRNLEERAMVYTFFQKYLE